MSVKFLIDIDGGVLGGRQVDPVSSDRHAEAPLIVALHGGSYSSAYFDIPGYSLLDRAAAAGCPAVAFDRPGYGASTRLTVTGGLLHENGARLANGIGKLWQQESGRSKGVVVVGHSIGAAIAILIAARPQPWPLLGIAVSGMGIAPPPGGPTYEGENALDQLQVIPDEVKNKFMFGPPGSYLEGAPERAAVANEPLILREVVEINTEWPRYARDAMAGVRVPVHYRLAEHDLAWPNCAENIEAIKAALPNAARVDAAVVEEAGHCIDFHHAGDAFQEQQISFAISCAT